jgi:serine protease Do
MSFTVSRGIVSYVGREVEGTRYLQTDLPINDGNSGGPVVNARGELVGLMSFVLKRSQGLSFALPFNYAAVRFAARLGKHAQAGDYLDRFRRWLGRR